MFGLVHNLLKIILFILCFVYYIESGDINAPDQSVTTHIPIEAGDGSIQQEQPGNDNNYVTQEELCETNTSKGFIKLEVDSAFMIGDYIAITGKVWKNKDSDAKRLAIRSMYWHQPDPSGHTPYKYFDTKVWPELKSIDSKKNIRFAFTTRKVKIIEPQKVSEVVFIIKDDNVTTAYLFDKRKVENMTEPTYDPKSDEVIVYDPQQGWDDSGFLRIKHLFMHFPHEMRIITILVFERQKQIRYKSPGFLERIKVSPFLHHSIVYTEEEIEGQRYYYRHYLRSERHLFSDSITGVTFESLDWFFDENIDFCDELTNSPTAVVMLHLAEDTEIYDKQNYWKSVFYFAEFYGSKHKVMKISFPDIFTDKYIIQEVDGVDINNSDALLNCKHHPKFTNPERIDCLDYNAMVDNENPFHSKGESDVDEDNTFLLIAIIVVFVLIVVLIGFCVMEIIKE